MIAARLGFTPAEVAEDATSILDGLPTTDPMIVNGRPYTIRVRLPDASRASLDAIERHGLQSARGHTATLGSLATVTQLPPQNEILPREPAAAGGGQRPPGRLRPRRSHAVRLANVSTAMQLPSRVRVEYGGTYQEQQKSFA